MAEEIIEENNAVTTGRELLDATQNAVINAVENVSEIIETKEEQKVVTKIEQIVEPKESFYLETEFWVAMAFFLLLIGLIWPISKVIKSLLKAKINDVTQRIDNAINLRDEAHRFAIGTHRKKRAKSMTKSSLDEIEGIGAWRKKELLKYFGSTKDVADASLSDLQKIAGISKKTAEKIYNYFHN